jgi:UDP-N-acetylmuramate--alanine ligase
MSTQQRPLNVAGRRIHFIGAGGVGVSALAELAYREGAVVTGCDRSANDRTEHLRTLGIPVEIGHHASHVGGVDWVVYTAAMPADHPELQAAQRRCRTFRRGTFLARLLEGRHVLGVCGTHGKTTTTWLLGQLLVHAGMDPTVLLGGVGAGERTNLRVGDSELVVVELDESDASFLEPALSVAIVTNVESDHLDHYEDFENVRAAFRTFARGVATCGVLVAGTDDPQSRRLREDHDGPAIGCGLDESSDVRAVEIEPRPEGQRFRLLSGSDRGVFEMRLPGEHNVKNALCAFGAARAIGAEWDELRRGLAACTPVSRRFEVVGRVGGVTVIDDYAHHPTEVSAAIRTARATACDRLIAVFQPHLFSRTAALARGFGAALAEADEIVLVDVYPAREDPIPGVDSGLVRAEVLPHNPRVSGPYARREALRTVEDRLRPGDTVLFMGAGDVGFCAHQLVERLRASGLGT